MRGVFNPCWQKSPASSSKQQQGAAVGKDGEPLCMKSSAPDTSSSFQAVTPRPLFYPKISHLKL